MLDKLLQRKDAEITVAFEEVAAAQAAEKKAKEEQQKTPKSTEEEFRETVRRETDQTTVARSRIESLSGESKPDLKSRLKKEGLAEDAIDEALRGTLRAEKESLATKLDLQPLYSTTKKEEEQPLYRTEPDKALYEQTPKAQERDLPEAVQQTNSAYKSSEVQGSVLSTGPSSTYKR